MKENERGNGRGLPEDDSLLLRGTVMEGVMVKVATMGPRVWAVAVGLEQSVAMEP